MVDGRRASTSPFEQQRHICGEICRSDEFVKIDAEQSHAHYGGSSKESAECLLSPTACQKLPVRHRPQWVRPIARTNSSQFTTFAISPHKAIRPEAHSAAEATMNGAPLAV
jgi:hypothetical protein